MSSMTLRVVTDWLFIVFLHFVSLSFGFLFPISVFVFESKENIDVYLSFGDEFYVVIISTLFEVLDSQLLLVLMIITVVLDSTLLGGAAIALVLLIGLKD